MRAADFSAKLFTRLLFEVPVNRNEAHLRRVAGKEEVHGLGRFVELPAKRQFPPREEEVEAFGNGFAAFGFKAREGNLCAREARNREASERQRELCVARAGGFDGGNGKALSGIPVVFESSRRRFEGPALEPRERRA